MSIFDKLVRKAFCKNELKEGDIITIWKDVDGEVSGWLSRADHEDTVLCKISLLISEKKTEKLEKITGITSGKMEHSQDDECPIDED